jgi:hypothetical protein
MRGLSSVLRHEIVQRRLLLGASPLLGLLPLAAPLLPGTTGTSNAELRDTAALFLALALSGFSALLLGPAVIGADLAARRLAFFFSRPLSGAAVWAGKLGAAAIVAWAAGLLALLPVLLIDAVTGGNGGLLHNPLLPLILLAIWLLAVPVVILATHLGGVLLRTRSAWLLLDLAGAVTACTIALLTVRRLQYWGALDRWSVELLYAIGAGLAVVAMLAASAAQVIAGRTDPVRGHRIQSLTLAGISLAATLTFAAVAQHWIAIGPQDLERWSWALAAPGQGWIALSGPAPGPRAYGASFLLQTTSGRSFRARFAPITDYSLPVAFSADGRRAVWAEYEGEPGSSAGVLLRLDLDRPAAAPVRTPIVERTPPHGLTISPRGDRIATVAEQQVSVYDLDSGRLLAAHTLPGPWAAAVFMGEERLRLLISRYQGVREVMEVADFDLTTRKLVGRATFPVPGWLRGLSPDASRIVFNHGAPSAVTVFDLASGKQLAGLSQPGVQVRAHYLADGRLAELVAEPAGTVLTVLDGAGLLPPGAPRFRLPVGTAIVRIVQADADRLLALERWRRRGPRLEGGWQLIDLRQGRTQPLGPPSLQLIAPLPHEPAGSAPLFTDGTHLLRIDLATGKRQILGPARPFYFAYLPPL